MRYASIDIETCGLDRKTHDIIEFGAVLDDLKNQVDIDKLPKFHCYFLPPSGENFTGSPFALSMHQKIFLRIANREKPFTYVHPMKFGFMFRKFLVKNGYQEEHDQVVINVAGKNFGAFDLPFLAERTDLLKHVNIRHRIIDPSILYVLNGDEALPGTKDCKERRNFKFGITDDIEVAHTAIDDAVDVIKLVRSGLKNIFPPPDPVCKKCGAKLTYHDSGYFCPKCDI